MKQLSLKPGFFWGFVWGVGLTMLACALGWLHPIFEWMEKVWYRFLAWIEPIWTPVINWLRSDWWITFGHNTDTVYRAGGPVWSWLLLVVLILLAIGIYFRTKKKLSNWKQWLNPRAYRKPKNSAPDGAN